MKTTYFLKLCEFSIGFTGYYRKHFIPNFNDFLGTLTVASRGVEVVVGYRMVIFQITERNSSIDVACAPEHFDTFFKEIGQKLRQCRPKHCLGGWGRAKNLKFFETVLCWH